MAKLPVTPLLAFSVAMISSTGHGRPSIDARPILEDVRDWTQELATLTSGTRELLAGAGNKIATTLDRVRIAVNLPAPDLTMLRVEPVANCATSGFGWREDPITKRRKFHAGADIRGGYGTPVHVAGDGKVTFAGYKNGYGNLIMIDHGGGIATRYAHLRRIEVKQDAQVTAGQRIGQVGATGRTTGPHLHFEVRIDGHPVDPTVALAVAELERTSPAAGHLAAQVLAPDVQAAKLSDVDPPKDPKAKLDKDKRPERKNAPKRAPKPLS